MDWFAPRGLQYTLRNPRSVAESSNSCSIYFFNGAPRILRTWNLLGNELKSLKINLFKALTKNENFLLEPESSYTVN